ncbi:peptidyl-prolyl cis-trans isomerase [Bacillus fonticola]|uniref:peptidyl-prolyl cis-trans isomerase n=1 Tax=Bacillus fonticola TaxID=2728853 RepID=UPI001472C171|nr:peptidyl-prolyl cis-trans isomerase [Bacillus fonticola]
MSDILQITGEVHYTITLDPSVWIFDDRRVDMEKWLAGDHGTEEKVDSAKVLSKEWEKEIRESKIAPPTVKTERKYKKQEILEGTFGMPLQPFFENAEPTDGASRVVVETVAEPVILPLDKALNSIAGFSNKGKPLREDGPVHLYFADGSNKDEPIRNVRGFRFE